MGHHVGLLQAISLHIHLCLKSSVRDWGEGFFFLFSGSLRDDEEGAVCSPHVYLYVLTKFAHLLLLWLFLKDLIFKRFH